MISPRVLDRIVAAKDSATDLRLALPARERVSETKVRYVRCPRCAETMNRQAFGRISGVVVDVCRKDGVWFDAGELVAVLAFVERGGLTRARERERAELEEAARTLRAERMISGATGGLSPGATLGSSEGRAMGIGSDIIRALADLWS